MDEEKREILEGNKSPFIDPGQPIDYRLGVTPLSYHCGMCEKTGIKLWMDRDEILPYLELRCIVCVAAAERVSLEGLYLQANGQIWGAVWGWEYFVFETPRFVPSIPFPSNDTFYRWDNTHKPPPNALGWWGLLPLW